MMQNLPDYFKSAELKIAELLEEGESFKEKTKFYQWKAFIKNFTKLSIYGFNSSSFDIPAMAGTFFTVGEEYFCDEISALKRGSSQGSAYVLVYRNHY